MSKFRPRHLLTLVLAICLFIISSPSSSSSPVALEPARGLSVQPNAHGMLEAAYDLKVPPGTRGMEPGLRLVHSTEGLAENWDVQGMPEIQRKGDNYYFQGAVLVSDGNYLITRPMDGTRFEKIGDCSIGCHFERRLSDGTLQVYGESQDAQVGGEIWKLESAQDLNENSIEYRYLREGALLLPSEIIYTKNPGANLAVRRVVFEYEDTQAPLKFKAGDRANATKRISNIRAEYEGRSIYEYELDYQAGRLSSIQRFIEGSRVEAPVTIQYRNPGLNYQSVATPANTGMGMPDGNACNVGAVACLALQTGNYTPNTLLPNQVACAVYQSEKWCDIGNPRRPADINGDGRLDIFSTLDDANDYVVQITSETGTSTVYSAPIGIGEPGTHFMADMNRDGRSDLVRMAIVPGFPTRYVFHVSYWTGSGFSAVQEFDAPNGMGMGYDEDLFLKQILNLWVNMRIAKLQKKSRKPFGGAKHARKAGRLEIGQAILQSSNEQPGFTQFADMNKDGYPDVIRLMDDQSVHVAFSNGSSFHSDTASYPPMGPEGDAGFRAVSDFNGDGIPDLYTISSDGRMRVSLGRTDGTFHHSYTSAPLNAGEKEHRSVQDLNGDGYGDYVRMTPGYLMVAFGTGAGLEDHHFAVHLGAATGRDFADVNGDGYQDFIRFVYNGSELQAVAQLYGTNGYDGDSVPLPVTYIDEMDLARHTLLFDDRNGDGREDMLALGDGQIRSIVTPADDRNLIDSVSDGYNEFHMEYEPRLSLASPQDNTVFPDAVVRADTTPGFVAVAIEQHVRGNPVQRTTFEYERPKLALFTDDAGSARRLGFTRLTTRNYFWNGSWVDGATYTKTEFKDFNPANPNVAGLASEILTYRVATELVIGKEEKEYRSFNIGSSYRIVQESSVTRDFLSGLEKRTAVQSFDDYGNPTEVFRQGDISVPGDDRISRTQYEYPSNAPYGRPVEERELTSGGTTISLTRTTYGSGGNAVVTESGRNESSLTTVTRQFDNTGFAIRQTQNGRTTNLTPDPETHNAAVQTTSSGGSNQTVEYSPARGLALSSSDQTGRTMLMEHDALGRQIRTEVAGNGWLEDSDVLKSSEYHRSLDGSMEVREAQTVGRGQLIETTYVSPKGLEERKVRAGENAVTINTTHDAFGRPLFRSLPHSGSPSGGQDYAYDDLGRMTEVTAPGPNGSIVSSIPVSVQRIQFTSNHGVTLSGFGKPEHRPNGQTIYDFETDDGKPLQRLQQTSYHQNGSLVHGWLRIRYHYDAVGDLRAVTRGFGPTHESISDNPALTATIDYDNYGRKIRVSDPDRGTIQYSYRADGLISCITQPSGRQLCYDYDAAGRKTRIRHGGPSGEVVASMAYGEGFSENGEGRLTSIRDDSGTRRFHYDSKTGKVSRMEREYVVNGQTKEFDIVNHYSPDGRLLKREFPESEVSLIFEYFPEGALKSVMLQDPYQRLLDSGSSAEILQVTSLDDQGNPARIEYGNGVAVNMERGIAGEVERMTARSPYGTVSDYSYEYTDEGLISEKIDHLKGGGVDRTERFQYDVARRLIRATGPYGDRADPVREISYRFGPDGQFMGADEKTAQYEQLHRLKSYDGVEYLYDTESGAGDGNVVQREKHSTTTQYFYNWQNRVSRVHSTGPEGGLRADYRYESDGRRFSKSSVGGEEPMQVHYMSDDYRIYQVGSQEIHSLEIRDNGALLARMRFSQRHHLAAGPANGSMYLDRLVQDLYRIVNMDGGLAALPGLLGRAMHHAKLATGRYSLSTAQMHWIFMTFVVLASLVALFLYLRDLKREREERGRMFPVLRPIALTTVLVFYAAIISGCTGNPTADTMVPLPDGTYSRMNSGSTDATIMGSYFYISTHNGSTDVVTNSVGEVVARYAYEPFGRVVKELSDMDADGDGIAYAGTFQFTGQEYEEETGLYNYKARLYDPDTGRFLQPDPVHTAQPGQDNWDRYAYVWNNPVNFTDPTGNSPLLPLGSTLSSMAIGLATLAGITTLFNPCGKPFIGGRYAGAGACKKVRPGRDEAMYILAALLSTDPDIQAKALIFFLYLRAKSPRGLSMADSVSRLHDRDSPNFMHSSKTQGNNAFIRRNTSLWVGGGLFGPIPTKRTWDKTFHRERDALPAWAGDGSFAELAAGINTIGTLFGDYLITGLGTMLFWTTNQLNYMGQALGEWANNALVPPGGINFKLDLGKIDLGNLGSGRMKFSISIDQNRFKYLDSPTKWTL